MNRRANQPLTVYQRSVIQYLLKKGKSPEEIQKDEELQRSDETPILLSTVRYWAKRFSDSGGVEVKPRKGRPKVVNDKQEKKLVRLIEKHGDRSYSTIKSKTGFPGDRRSLNNIALKNGFRKF